MTDPARGEGGAVPRDGGGAGQGPGRVKVRARLTAWVTGGGFNGGAVAGCGLSARDHPRARHES